METKIGINNQPSASELWDGIGGHFDSLGQIINEFLDNSISNFAANVQTSRNIIVGLRELADERVKITVEDTGTGIKDLDAAFTLGNQTAGETPLNEHGFGLKHALASANPANDAWAIYTRTKEDFDNNVFKKISAPYDIEDFSGALCENEQWPGTYTGTGTIIEFTCTREMYKTLGRGIRGGASVFLTLADILCEDIGFVYSGVIANGIANITLHMIPKGNAAPLTRAVGAVTPDWSDWLGPGKGSESVDLGGGEVDIDYSFGRINSKPERVQFDNTTARKYYLRNMSSSGVEIRINGRALCYNLFKEIWGIEKHNSYNYLLVIVNLKSEDAGALPKTRTSKNGLREGDPRLEALYQWIRSNMHEPQKDVSLSDHETDLFEELKKNKIQFNPDPNKVVDTEMRVFITTGNQKDRVRLDLYEKTSYGITVYEGKRESTTSKDVYQLRMYWDGLVFDGIKPDKGILVAESHPESVKELLQIVNAMKDANGNNYKLEASTWQDLGLDLSSR